MPNIKDIGLQFSEKKFELCFFCSYVQTCDRGERANFCLRGHHMNKLYRGPKGDGAFQISKLYAFQFHRRRILEIGSFAPMFQLVIPEAGSALTQGASYKQTWWRSIRGCYPPNIKTLGLPVAKKKNFEFFFLCSYVLTCGLVLSQVHHMNKLDRGPQEDVTYQISQL